MAYRKFKGIEYPVPGVDTAIQTLCPGGRWEMANQEFIGWEHDEGEKPPTWEEIEEEFFSNFRPRFKCNICFICRIAFWHPIFIFESQKLESFINIYLRAFTNSYHTYFGGVYALYF